MAIHGASIQRESDCQTLAATVRPKVRDGAGRGEKRSPKAPRAPPAGAGEAGAARDWDPAISWAKAVGEWATGRGRVGNWASFAASSPAGHGRVAGGRGLGPGRVLGEGDSPRGPGVHREGRGLGNPA